MKKVRIITGILVPFLTIFFASGCERARDASITYIENEPVIEPDYSGVTVPYNIAPMNFFIKEEGEGIRITIKSVNGSETEIKLKDKIAKFPAKSWKKLLNENKGGKIEITVITCDKENKIKEYAPFCIYVANEPIDQYLCYRLLFPGYESWSEMQIIQRSLENFKENSVIENQMLEDNCVNCHTFLKNDPAKFLIHVRGSLKGTYFVNGKHVTRKILRTGKMIANAVYPAWHPSGRYIVFSSNEVAQAFHLIHDKRIEVYDQSALLVNYDCERDEISAVEENDTLKYMETFPCWSPDGDWLYYCRTKQISRNFDYRNVRYDLIRRSFDNLTGSFGKDEVVFNAHEKGKSVSFPNISPDGNYLIFTVHNYGTFPIWHKEADLYLLDLNNEKIDSMSLNSREAESYHSWSSNGKWLVFSSKRGDGLTARLYFAYFGSPGNIGKPFVLPQKDPTLYDRLGKTFNRPEFITGRITAGSRDFARASKNEPVKAIWIDPDR